MTTHDNKPYTYLIGWRRRDIWYYGSRHANVDSPENDLWHQYFTSSRYVEEIREKFGEPDVIKVHRLFDTPDQAHQFEYRFLKRVNAKNSSRWLNQTIMGAPMGGTPNQLAWARRPKSEATKEKMRLAALKRWGDDDKNRERASAAFKKNNPNAGGVVHKGRKRTDAQRTNISNGQLNRVRRSAEPKVCAPREIINAKISESLKSHTRTPEHKANIGKAYNNSEQARENRRDAQQRRRRRELEKKRSIS